MNGLLLIDKPAGITSHDVVGSVRRSLRQKTVGHTGTLDPMATGLMVLVLGEATKLSDYLTFSDKVYRLKCQLGIETDTLDRTGTVTRECAVDLKPDQIREAAQSLQGTFSWPVPLFSATKVDGKKLYEYGRGGETIDLPRKEMSFSEISIHEITENTVDLTLRCSKGSFVRTWCSQLGERLGVGGCLSELSRIEVGPYHLVEALSLRDVEKDPTCINRSFISMAEALPHWRSISVPGKDERLLMNGQIPRDLANRLIVEQKEASKTNVSIGVKVTGSSGELISILMAQPGQGLKIRRVFRLDPQASAH